MFLDMLRLQDAGVARTMLVVKSGGMVRLVQQPVPLVVTDLELADAAVCIRQQDDDTLRHVCRGAERQQQAEGREQSFPHAPYSPVTRTTKVVSRTPMVPPGISTEAALGESLAISPET